MKTRKKQKTYQTKIKKLPVILQEVCPNERLVEVNSVEIKGKQKCLPALCIMQDK